MTADPPGDHQHPPDLDQMIEDPAWSAPDEMARRDFTPQFKTDLMAKDLRQVAALAESVHAPIPFSALAKQIFSGAQALGHGGDDMNAVLEVFTRLGGK